MDYTVLATFPALALIVVGILTLIIKGTFHRQGNLIVERQKQPSKKVLISGFKPDETTLTATYDRRRSIFIFCAITALALWLSWQIITINDPMVNAFKPFYILFGAYALVQFFVASFVKPYKNTLDVTHQSVKNPETAVLVPVYNEDVDGLKKGLRSLMTQTVLPSEIHVVDDGSTVDYTAVRQWLKRSAKRHNITATWTRQENKGKRAAQILAYSNVDTDRVSIIVTVDSDGELDPHALEESLKPFIMDRDIQSVAGIVIAKNAQDNWLARITDLIFVSHQQLIDRATMSAMKSVIVNSGGLALYRKEVLESAIQNDYDNEYFMGRKVTFSDDSYLTLIALKMGKTVQQPTAIVFSDMPVKLSHHVRQQVRWGRGSFIRGWWRIRYLPLMSPGFLRQMLGWMVFISITLVQILLLIVIPIATQKLPSLYLLLVPMLFTFLLSARYFSVKRSDMSARSQLITYLLAPLAMAWSAIVLRGIRLYAMATCLKTGWGTRQKVEIVYDNTTRELAPSSLK